MLHIISSLPLSPLFIENTKSGDTIIFTDDAVFAVKQNTKIELLAYKAFSHINLCVRKADLIIKNISKSDLLRNVVIIDEAQYVNATTEEFAVKSCN